MRTSDVNDKPRIGLIVSSSCATRAEAEKRWYHFRRFANDYHEVLSAYKFLLPRDTVNTVEKFGTDIDLEQLGEDNFEGIVRLAALVAKGEINRVLMFQDPEDLAIEEAPSYALLRNCNLRGAHFLVNAAAHLWALHQATNNGRPPGKPYSKEPVDWHGFKETVAFIAHDREKPRMARFALHFRDVLRRFRLIGTSGTVSSIRNHLREFVPPRERLPIYPVGAPAGTTERAVKHMGHGPAGGDVIIAEEMFNWYAAPMPQDLSLQVFHHVLFFIDHKHSHPHEPDIQVLLKTCIDPRHRVNLILNSRMAEEWAERYTSA